jgi:uncharacterized protein
MPYLPKDFIETAEGLCFAVVQLGTEHNNGQEKVLCFLRYIRQDFENNRIWLKVSTEQANAYLKDQYSGYLYHSEFSDADLHAVAIDRITRHHKPKDRLQEILASQHRDKVAQDLVDLCSLFQRNGLDLTQVGVTGSILLGAQQQSSDIDVVMYDRESFHKARTITATLINTQHLSQLNEKDWQEAYARRACSLSLQDYVWHERRKFNKALIQGRKFDLNFVYEKANNKSMMYHKLGNITVQCKIIEDCYSFDYPALYKIDHDTINSVVCFIATYTGQAVNGETVEIAGLLEQAEDGAKRIVVGSSREAAGEYIKVIQC